MSLNCCVSPKLWTPPLPTASSPCPNGTEKIGQRLFSFPIHAQLASPQDLLWCGNWRHRRKREPLRIKICRMWWEWEGFKKKFFIIFLFKGERNACMKITRIPFDDENRSQIAEMWSHLKNTCASNDTCAFLKLWNCIVAWFSFVGLQKREMCARLSKAAGLGTNNVRSPGNDSLAWIGL